ncbi:MAG: DUF1254 domain-containing protein [Caulobacteraceae bacterium]
MSGAALAVLARPGLPDRAAAATLPIETADLRTSAREAWIYGLPLIEAARLRAAAIGDKPQEGKAGFNNFLHQRAPATPDLRDVSAPEPDVLYSSAWIHLGGGPARISVPATGGRYFNLALFDLYGNVLGLVEGREASKDGHEITVIGPPSRVGMAGYTAPMPRMPAMHKMIHARSLWVWALARTHLEGDQDLAAAHTLQDGLDIKVKPAKTPPRPAGPVARDAPWSDYFFAVQQLIDETRRRRTTRASSAASRRCRSASRAASRRRASPTSRPARSPRAPRRRWCWRPGRPRARRWTAGSGRRTTLAHSARTSSTAPRSPSPSRGRSDRRP